MGLTDKAKEQLTKLDQLSSSGYYVSPRAQVWVLLGLGDSEGAFDILEKALTDHLIDPVTFWLHFYPIESLQNDPLFSDMLRITGLTG